MKIVINILAISILFLSTKSAEKTKIYLIPGQGSDERVYNKIEFPSKYEVVHIKYEMPGENENMATYAQRLSNQIKEENGFILIGVSLGGMIASEIAEFKNPDQVIIISSAKNSTELPKRYNFQKKIPIYKMVGPKLSKRGAKILQPIVEPVSKKEKEIFLLEAKDPVFLERTISMIINWDRETNSKEIIHIHGNKDHTIPIKKVNCDYLINEGSHMMTLTKSDEVNEILNEILND